MKKTVVILALLLSPSIFCQTISTESPSFSAGGMTVPKNIFQVETNLGVNINSNLSGVTQDYVLPTSLLRYGITNRFEVRVNAATSLNAGIYRFSTMNVGVKYNLIGQKSEKFQISIIASYELPILKNSIHFNGRSILTFNYDFNDKHSLGANLGYVYKEFRFPSTTSKNQSNNIFGTLIYNYKILDNLSCFIEGYLNTALIYFTSESGIPPSSFDNYNSFSWDTGLLYQINDRMQIDYVFGMDIPYNNQFHMLGFHFMLDFNKKK